jgi:hypothetical protein
MTKALIPGPSLNRRSGPSKELVIAAQQPRRAARYFHGFQARVDETGRDIDVPKQAHLILHQCNQRRDDQGDARLQQGRQLKTEGFSAAGRHQG